MRESQVRVAVPCNTYLGLFFMALPVAHLPGLAVMEAPCPTMLGRCKHIKPNIYTDLTKICIPYTSVFLQLECGYWNGEAEHRLRAAMRSKDTSNTQHGLPNGDSLLQGQSA